MVGSSHALNLLQRSHPERESKAGRNDPGQLVAAKGQIKAKCLAASEYWPAATSFYATSTKVTDAELCRQINSYFSRTINTVPTHVSS